MKTLILATDYPDLEGNISLFYIHTRSIFYLKNKINFEILNFKAQKDYVVDGVKVITLNTYKNSGFFFSPLRLISLYFFLLCPEALFKSVK